MRLLDAMPEVEKTSIFGTSVHAVLRVPARPPTAIADAGLAGQGRRPIETSVVEPSLEDVFLDLADAQAPERVMIGGKTRAVATKELRQILRDRRTLLILLFVPAFFLLVYGYALNFDIRNIRLAVQDNDRSSVSRELISAFVNSGYFDLVADVHEPGRRSTGVIDRNDARAVLVIPARFGADARTRRATDGAADRQRRQRQHRHDGRRLRPRPGERAVHALRDRGAARLSGPGRCSRSSRASGTTRSSAARCFSFQA